MSRRFCFLTQSYSKPSLILNTTSENVNSSEIFLNEDCVVFWAASIIYPKTTKNSTKLNFLNPQSLSLKPNISKQYHQQYHYQRVALFDMTSEVNISSYPVTPVTGLFFSSCAEIFKLGYFVQKYSDLGFSCRNICQVPFRVTQSEKCILEKVTQMIL